MARTAVIETVRIGAPMRDLRYSAASILASVAVSLGVSALTTPALARSTIREPGAHPSYQVELDPHLVYGPFAPPGPHTGDGLGFGLRATIPIVQNGFIRKINNSVGISFGFDWMRYWGDNQNIGNCSRWTVGPGNTHICTQVGDEEGGDSTYLLFPVAMQWNFWLAEKFSAFGEPGLVFYSEKAVYEDNWHMGARPLLQVGGRFHFSPNAALTFRLGYPNVSLGVSLLF